MFDRRKFGDKGRYPPGVRRISPAVVVAIVFGAIAVLGTVALWWGQSVVTDEARIYITPPGFHGEWEVPVDPLLWPLALALVAVGGIAWAIWTGRVPKPAVPAAAAAASAAWMTGLAATEGREGFTDPVEATTEYLPVLDQIDDIGTFVSTYTERLVDYPIHVKGHPPGFSVLLWLMDQIQLATPGWIAAMIILVTASGVAALTVSIRWLVGDDAATLAAPIVGVAPWVVWAAVSADGFIGGIVCWCLAGAIAATSITITRARRDGAAVVAGLLAGAALMLTYGAPLMILPAAAVMLWRRDIRSIVAATIAALLVVGAFALAGFWWFDGLSTTREFYDLGVANRRPYEYFLVANLVVAAAAIGPATAAGLALLRDRRLWVPVGAAGIGLLLADLSGLSKAEVERIWIPFFMILGMAVVGALGLVSRSALVVPRERATKLAAGLLAIQLATGAIWELALDTGW